MNKDRYEFEWVHGLCVVRDNHAPEGNKIMMMMPESMGWFVSRMNEAYRQGCEAGRAAALAENN